MRKIVELTKNILHHIQLEINSNGDVIKKNVNKLLDLYVAGLDTIVISVYDGIKEYKMLSLIHI